MTKNIKEIILDMVYPRTCPFCGKIPKEKGAVCKQCKMGLPYIQGARCMKCSKPIMDMEDEYCYDCKSKNHSYVSGKALWIYDDTMRASISRYKYQGRLEYADVYSEEIAKYYGEWIKLHGDVLIPVPLYKKKRRVRGFNQAETLAERLGQKLQIPVGSNWLCRRKDTLPQKELSDVERKKNLTEAFEVNKESFLMVKKVILVDDIYTTGSTIEACARVLYDAGVKEVYFISLCIGKGF